MNRHNEDIRTQARRAGVYLYEVADALGVHETTLIRWLRGHLETGKRDAIISAIKTAEANKESL